MKTITLDDAIKTELKDKEFAIHFERELLINQIAEMIVKMRQEANLTQKQLAQKAGTTQPVIARLESGTDYRIPSLELLAKLAKAANSHLNINITH